MIKLHSTSTDTQIDSWPPQYLTSKCGSGEGFSQVKELKEKKSNELIATCYCDGVEDVPHLIKQRVLTHHSLASVNRVQLMAWRLAGAKLLSEPILGHC